MIADEIRLKPSENEKETPKMNNTSETGYDSTFISYGSNYILPDVPITYTDPSLINIRNTALQTAVQFCSASKNNTNESVISLARDIENYLKNG